MKISISHSLINAISVQALSIVHHLNVIEKTHPLFKGIKDSIRTPSTNDIFNSLLESKVSKMGTIVKTEDSIDIEINDDFIIEAYALGTGLVIKSLKPVADLLLIHKQHEVHVNQFEERWRDVPETFNADDLIFKHTTSDNNSLDTDLSTVDNWKLIHIENSKEGVWWLPSCHNSLIILVKSTTWHNYKLDKTFVLCPNNTIRILGTTLDQDTLVNTSGLPKELIEAVRKHYFSS